MSLPLLPPSTLYDAGQCLNGHNNDSLRAYGQACRAAALEEAAEICRNEEWRNDGNEVAYLKAFNEGCDDCEAAIRRLK